MTANTLAKKFAADVAKRTNVGLWPHAAYGVRVRNKAETREHGWLDGAEASISFEGADDLMIAMTLELQWVDEARRAGFFFEPYASYLIGVYKL